MSIEVTIAELGRIFSLNPSSLAGLQARGQLALRRGPEGGILLEPRFGLLLFLASKLRRIVRGGRLEELRSLVNGALDAPEDGARPLLLANLENGNLTLLRAATSAITVSPGCLLFDLVETERGIATRTSRAAIAREEADNLTLAIGDPMWDTDPARRAAAVAAAEAEGEPK